MISRGRYIPFTLILLLTACVPTTKAIPKEGIILNGTPSEALEQCKTQPNLDWCKVTVTHAN